jgi:hypothetical protein
MAGTALCVAGVCLLADATGALCWPDERLLVVADLHLEKGSFFATRGQMLPPYDTLATLGLVTRAVARHRPRTIVFLGDSFHDAGGEARLPPAALAAIAALGAGRELIWLAGNHDRERPVTLPGTAAQELAIGPLVLRHEPAAGAAPGEIAGHLHPVARVLGSGGAVRRRAFVSDGARLVMPAMGAYAGGLNLRQPALAGLFEAERLRAYVMGSSRVYAVGPARLVGD